MLAAWSVLASAPVSRQAMAGFIGRGLGRIGVTEALFHASVSDMDGTLDTFAVFEIGPGESATYALQGTATLSSDLENDRVLFGNPIITAVYVPFGPDGDNTLAYGD